MNATKRLPLNMPHTDAAQRDYFVSIVRSSKQRGLLAGPFSTHTEALALVDKASRLARELDTWADFDAFGTCSLPRPSGRVGVLNTRLGIIPPPPY